jgi:hypothetical protein
MEKLLGGVSSITEEILKHYHKHTFKGDHERVLFALIDRIHINYTIASDSLKRYLKFPRFRFAIYTLLRPLLSDFILQVYLIKHVEFDAADFMNRYKEVSTLFYQKFESLLEDQIKGKVVTDVERNEYFRSGKISNPEFFEEKRLKVKKVKSQFQPRQLTEEIKKGDYKEFADVYDLYFLLSQYEHFSEKTEEMMQSVYELDYKLVSPCCNFILRGVALNISIIDPQSPFLPKLMELIDKISDEFIQFQNSDTK